MPVEVTTLQSQQGWVTILFTEATGMTIASHFQETISYTAVRETICFAETIKRQLPEAMALISSMAEAETIRSWAAGSPTPSMEVLVMTSSRAMKSSASPQIFLGQ